MTEKKTPTTEAVRLAYIADRLPKVWAVGDAEAEFDRWHRAELARAWDEGAVEALERIDNGYDSVLMNVNPYRQGEAS